MKVIIFFFIIMTLTYGNLLSETTSPSTPIKGVELTKEERKLLDTLGPLKVMVDETFPPISYFDINTNEFGGIAVEVLARISKTFDFKYEIIHAPNTNWSEKLNRIRNNKIHILGGASKNKGRKKYGYFSDLSYFTANYALIGSIHNHKLIRNIEDASLYNIGLVEGATINATILAQIQDKSRVSYYKNRDEAFRALKDKTIDFYPYNAAVFTEEYFQGNMFDFEISLSLNKPTKNYAFFSPKTAEGKALTVILNKGIKALNINEITQKHYNNESIFSFYKRHTDKLNNSIKNRDIVLATITVVLFAIILMVLLLKKEAKKKVQLIKKLEDALSEVNTLQGILPICCQCKQVRDDTGYWQQVEQYISKHSEATFSHGFCPDCYEKELTRIEAWGKKNQSS